MATSADFPSQHDETGSTSCSFKCRPKIGYFEDTKIRAGKSIDRGACKGKRDATDVWRENLAKAAKPLDGAHNAKTRRSNKMTD